ncbi:hypothetical protein [Paraburkholderia kururiensis]|uniref:hypothetical protein n=1 Tax=Paraburkholderia kururiensis TaxID=984307 RepID=UPI0005A76F65|nr:hypothetical protein [Paraburkholderia kururiensis]
MNDDKQPVAFMYRDGGAWELAFADDKGELSVPHARKYALYTYPAHTESAAPVDMVLFCPKCGVQHIDGPEWHNEADASIGLQIKEVVTWTNPPHRSHLCHHCGFIWRPADVPTNGVASIKTCGKNDSPPPASSPVSAAPVGAYPSRLFNESDESLARRVDSWHRRNPAPSPVSADSAALAVLKRLVALKDHKDEYGKTEHYEQWQPVAWEDARVVIAPAPSPVSGADERAAHISDYLSAPGMWAQVYCCAVFVRGWPSDMARGAADVAVKEFGDAACKTVVDLTNTLDEVLRVD